ncbi:MAG TPA: hypothetical protein VMG30_20805 [Acidobacteriota bacterium]|nr:hypothetical protein [Acidobacteriota bacterium]
MLQPPLGAQFDAPETPPLEGDANVEIFSSRFRLSQAGHFTFEISTTLGTSVSNELPHSRQSNS